ncbi:MAG TPA: hypothetical protein VE616_01370, partial [Candidatus Udaeobacter sp.]|nr:hypothetical protein [Candidatus Udaeobacter sp.]
MAYIEHARSVRNEATGFGEVWSSRRRGKSLAYCHLEYAVSVLGKHRAFRKDQRVSVVLDHGGERLVESFWTARLNALQLNPKSTSLLLYVLWNI